MHYQFEETGLHENDLFFLKNLYYGVMISIHDAPTLQG